MQLPSEEQWEYACRAGTTDPWFWGLVETDLVRVVNLRDRRMSQILTDLGFHAWDDGHTVHAPIASYPPNDFGLHDMHGNVAEWCRDWFESDPMTVGTPRRRHFRGGSYYQKAIYCRSAFRQFELPTGNNPARGMRVAMAAEASR
jgi:formylglycine-generating enzyme required for sulfatase activity